MITQEELDQNLIAACLKSDYNTVLKAIQDGASVNPNVNDGWTPLHLACNNSNIEIVRLLLSRGADVKAMVSGWTPLHIACNKKGKIEIIKLLLSRGADVKAKAGEFTPLILASQEDSDKDIKNLIATKVTQVEDLGAAIKALTALQEALAHKDTTDDDLRFAALGTKDNNLKNIILNEDPINRHRLHVLTGDMTFDVDEDVDVAEIDKAMMVLDCFPGPNSFSSLNGAAKNTIKSKVDKLARQTETDRTLALAREVAETQKKLLATYEINDPEYKILQPLSDADLQIFKTLTHDECSTLAELLAKDGVQYKELITKLPSKKDHVSYLLFFGAEVAHTYMTQYKTEDFFSKAQPNINDTTTKSPAFVKAYKAQLGKDEIPKTVARKIVNNLLQDHTLLRDAASALINVNGGEYVTLCNNLAKCDLSEIDRLCSDQHRATLICHIMNNKGLLEFLGMEEIKKAFWFEDLNTVKEKLLPKIKQYASNHKLNDKAFLSAWQAFCPNQSKDFSVATSKDFNPIKLFAFDKAEQDFLISLFTNTNPTYLAPFLENPKQTKLLLMDLDMRKKMLGDDEKDKGFCILRILRNQDVKNYPRIIQQWIDLSQSNEVQGFLQQMHDKLIGADKQLMELVIRNLISLTEKESNWLIGSVFDKSLRVDDALTLLLYNFVPMIFHDENMKDTLEGQIKRRLADSNDELQLITNMIAEKAARVTYGANLNNGTLLRAWQGTLAHNVRLQAIKKATNTIEQLETLFYFIDKEPEKYLWFADLVKEEERNPIFVQLLNNKDEFNKIYNDEGLKLKIAACKTKEELDAIIAAASNLPIKEDQEFVNHISQWLTEDRKTQIKQNLQTITSKDLSWLKNLCADSVKTHIVASILALDTPLIDFVMKDEVLKLKFDEMIGAGLDGSKILQGIFKSYIASLSQGTDVDNILKDMRLMMRLPDAFELDINQIKILTSLDFEQFDWIVSLYKQDKNTESLKQVLALSKESINILYDQRHRRKETILHDMDELSEYAGIKDLSDIVESTKTLKAKHISTTLNLKETIAGYVERKVGLLTTTVAMKTTINTSMTNLGLDGLIWLMSHSNRKNIVKLLQSENCSALYNQPIARLELEEMLSSSKSYTMRDFNLLADKHKESTENKQKIARHEMSTAATSSERLEAMKALLAELKIEDEELEDILHKDNKEIYASIAKFDNEQLKSFINLCKNPSHKNPLLAMTCNPQLFDRIFTTPAYRDRVLAKFENGFADEIEAIIRQIATAQRDEIFASKEIDIEARYNAIKTWSRVCDKNTNPTEYLLAQAILNGNVSGVTPARMMRFFSLNPRERDWMLSLYAKDNKVENTDEGESGAVDAVKIVDSGKVTDVMELLDLTKDLFQEVFTKRRDRAIKSYKDNKPITGYPFTYVSLDDDPRHVLSFAVNKDTWNERKILKLVYNLRDSYKKDSNEYRMWNAVCELFIGAKYKECPLALSTVQTLSPEHLNWISGFCTSPKYAARAISLITQLDRYQIEALHDKRNDEILKKNNFLTKQTSKGKEKKKDLSEMLLAVRSANKTATNMTNNSYQQWANTFSWKERNALYNANLSDDHKGILLAIDDNDTIEWVSGRIYDLQTGVRKSNAKGDIKELMTATAYQLTQIYKNPHAREKIERRCLRWSTDSASDNSLFKSDIPKVIASKHVLRKDRGSLGLSINQMVAGGVIAPIAIKVIQNKRLAGRKAKIDELTHSSEKYMKAIYDSINGLGSTIEHEQIRAFQENNDASTSTSSSSTPPSPAVERFNLLYTYVTKRSKNYHGITLAEEMTESEKNLHILKLFKALQTTEGLEFNFKPKPILKTLNHLTETNLAIGRRAAEKGKLKYKAAEGEWITKVIDEAKGSGNQDLINGLIRDNLRDENAQVFNNKIIEFNNDTSISNAQKSSTLSKIFPAFCVAAAKNPNTNIATQMARWNPEANNAAGNTFMSDFYLENTTKTERDVFADKIANNKIQPQDFIEDLAKFKRYLQSGLANKQTIENIIDAIPEDDNIKNRDLLFTMLGNVPILDNFNYSTIATHLKDVGPIEMAALFQHIPDKNKKALANALKTANTSLANSFTFLGIAAATGTAGDTSPRVKKQAQLISNLSQTPTKSSDMQKLIDESGITRNAILVLNKMRTHGLIADKALARGILNIDDIKEKGFKISHLILNAQMTDQLLQNALELLLLYPDRLVSKKDFKVAILAQLASNKLLLEPLITKLMALEGFTPAVQRFLADVINVQPVANISNDLKLLIRTKTATEASLKKAINPISQAAATTQPIVLTLDQAARNVLNRKWMTHNDIKSLFPENLDMAELNSNEKKLLAIAFAPITLVTAMNPLEKIKISSDAEHDILRDVFLQDDFEERLKHVDRDNIYEKLAKYRKELDGTRTERFAIGIGIKKEALSPNQKKFKKNFDGYYAREAAPNPSDLSEAASISSPVPEVATNLYLGNGIALHVVGGALIIASLQKNIKEIDTSWSLRDKRIDEGWTLTKVNNKNIVQNDLKAAATYIKNQCSASPQKMQLTFQKLGSNTTKTIDCVIDRECVHVGDDGASQSH